MAILSNLPLMSARPFVERPYALRRRPSKPSYASPFAVGLSPHLGMKNTRTYLYIILVAAVFAFVMAGTEAPEPPPAPTPSPSPTPMPLTLADQNDHPVLLAAEDDGLFHPRDAVTRKSAIDALGSLLDIQAERGMEALTAAGLLQIEPGAEAEELARGELSALLSALAGRLTGPEADRAALLADTVAGGILAEEGQATNVVTRGELAQVLVTLSGRTPDEDTLFFRQLLPPDVKRGDWAWDAIADAATDGIPVPAEAGFYRLEGWLYAADEDGKLLRDSTVDLWTFGADGAYTTGDAALDGYLRDALAESGANDLEGRAALEAVYLWVKEHFEYMLTPDDLIPEEDGSTGWEYERGRHAFENGGGTCYAYAAAFGLLARCLGEEAHIVAATINQYNGDHSFVVIPEAGVDWIYDVELEDVRTERHGELGLFRIENHTIYNYWYTPTW